MGDFTDSWLQGGRLLLFRDGQVFETEQSFGDSGELIFTEKRTGTQITFEPDDKGDFRVVWSNDHQTIRFRNLTLPVPVPGAVIVPIPEVPVTEVCVCSIRNSHGCTPQGCIDGTACGGGKCYYHESCPAAIAMPLMMTAGMIGIGKRRFRGCRA